MTLNALEWGAPGGPGLCLLHGGAAHAHWFDLVAPAFAERFHVIALDQRGHGESDWPRPAAYGTEDFAADLLGVFDALGWDRVILAGHSMGGHNAMAFASWHPARVRALVVIDSRPALPEDRLSMMHRRGERPVRRYATAGEAVAAFRLLPRDTVADPVLLAHLARAGVAQRDGGWSLRFDPDANRTRRPVDNWALVSRITAPTLIVRGERSPILPPDMAERLRRAITDARLVEIAGAYHHLVLDRPAEFTAVLARFLIDCIEGHD
ncbi:MAG TPA: alpha/beta hydrolase [Methylomirabilota bacterium]|nr:alpha/beta hydrolase [Methylomirabilota bacterium]